MQAEVWIVETENGSSMCLAEDNVLWICGLRDRPTAFNTKNSAQSAINRTNQYAKKREYPWEATQKIIRFSRG